jgi:hypothetical protein
MSQDNKTKESNRTHSEALAHIAQAVSSIRYGSVEIIIQDGKVVQIERKEKVRLTPKNTKNQEK